MARNWFVHCGVEQRPAMEACVRHLDPQGRAVFVDEAQGLRSLVRTVPAGSCCVAVGDGAELDPANLAAAVAADGHAAEVVVATERPDASMRARALRGGATRVVYLQAAGSQAGLTDERPRVAAGAPEAPEPERPHGEGDPVLPAPGAGGASLSLVPATARVPKDDEPQGHRVVEPVSSNDVPGQRLRDGEGPCLVLASARGGVGKSSIAAMMALEAASWGMDVALVDLDLAFGDIYDFFGLDGPADLTPLSHGWDPVALDAAGKVAAPHVTLYGPCLRPEFAETVTPHVGEVLAHLKRRHGLVVVDGSTTWSDSLAQAAQCCDRLLLVSDERAGAVGSLAKAASLAGRLGVAQARLVRLMNRCDPKGRDEGFLVRAAEWFEGARTHRVLEGGFDVSELLATGHAAELVELDEEFSRSCRAALAKVLADLGRLPDAPEARESRDLAVVRRGRLFRFAKEAV